MTLMPPEQEKFVKINAELAMIWPVVIAKKEPLPDAGKWNGVEGELQYLEK